MNRRAFLAASAVSAASIWHAKAEGKKYRACIIGDTKQGGYGHSFYNAFALRPDVEVTGLADPDEEGRAKAASASGALRTYADYREMLEKESPDIVAVGPRWTIHHKQYVLDCAAAGAHGFLEKPLCVDLEEADAMLAAVEAKNLKWALAYNFRMTPPVAHAKKCIDDGLIGTLLEARSRGKEDNRAGGEDLIVLGTHLFDLMRYFMGDPLWCSADFTHNGQPVTPADIREASEPLGPIIGNRCHVTWGFSKGTAGHFSSMKTKDGGGGRWGIDLHGTKGIISIRADVAPDVWWLDDPTWGPDKGVQQWDRLPGAPEFTIGDESKERHKPIVDDLIQAIEEDREPATGLRGSRVVQEMIQASFESCVAGRRVALPLPVRMHPLRRWS